MGNLLWKNEGKIARIWGRHDAMRVISARKANHREIKYYEDSTRDD